jgi:hypothetical protein
MANPNADQVARRLIILKYQVVQALATPPVLRQSYKNWSELDQQKFRSQLQEKLDELCLGLRNLELWEFLTDKEVEFFSMHPLDWSQQQMINASWRTESVMTLMWALGMIPEMLPFDHQSPPDMLKKIPNLDLQEYFTRAKLVDGEEIEKNRSLAEFWHWRSRTRRLIEEKCPFPKEIPQFKSYDEIVSFTVKAASERDGLKIIDEDFAVKGKAYRNLTDAEWSEVSSIAVERHFALNWLCGYAPDNHWDKTPPDT